MRVLGSKLRPARVRKLGGSRIQIMLTEGKNRQIRRMLRNIGNGVKKLRRTTVGKLELERLNLREGEHCVLTPQQISLLMK
jgi:16S rRNA U516 pseudouridylate synthase RsuA-like enzyme